MKNQIDDEKLVQDYAVNHRRGFTAIYNRYADRLVQYAISSFRLGSGEAEDAVHEAFLPWVERPGKMTKVKNLRAYLYTSTRNACLKRKKSGNCVDFPQNLSVEENGDISMQIDMTDALKRLPPDQAETIYLKIWGDMTFDQIAQVHQVNLQTTASRYRYALAKLKEVLKWEE